MFIPENCRMFLVPEPVSGRFGIHKLMAQLSSNRFNVNWDGSEEIVIMTFNKKRTISKLLIVDDKGVSVVTRILNQGKFQVEFTENHIPKNLNRQMLESLFISGKKLNS